MFCLPIVVGISAKTIEDIRNTTISYKINNKHKIINIFRKKHSNAKGRKKPLPIGIKLKNINAIRMIKLKKFTLHYRYTDYRFIMLLPIVSLANDFLNTEITVEASKDEREEVYFDMEAVFNLHIIFSIALQIIKLKKRRG